MNKIRFYHWIITLLVISNGLLLFWTLHKSNRHLHGDEPKNIVIQRLHFDESQVAQYEKLIDQHRKDIREHDQKIRNLKKELYQWLSKPEESTQMDSIALEIGRTQTEIEKIHMAHFQGIKAICTPDQMKDFDILSSDLAAIFSDKRANGKDKK